MITYISIEALSVFMGVHREQPWPTLLIEEWIIRNKRNFSEKLLRTGKLTFRQAMITALGCYLDINYSQASNYYDKHKVRQKNISMLMRHGSAGGKGRGENAEVNSVSEVR